MTGSAPPRRIVVGAGVTGLSAAWRTLRAGEEVVVLEASPRVGGVVRTERAGPYRVERAAAAFPSTAEHLLEVHASLPLPPAIHTPPPASNRQFFLTRRGLVALPRTPPAMIASPLLSGGAKVRALSEMLRGPDRVRTVESAHRFVRRRFGWAVAERFLKPMTLGIYGAAPEDLGAADAFPALTRMERESGSLLRALARRKGGARRGLVAFEDGMEALPSAIAQAMGDRVRTGTSAEALRREGDLVEVTTGGGERLLAREVVLATTADAQARLVAPLSAVAAETLASVRYVPIVVVSVGIPPGGSPEVPQAFGFLRAPGAGVRILGASFPSHLNPAVAPPGHALVSVFVGGASDPEALALSDDGLRAVVEHDLARALGGPVRPDVVSVYRWPRAIPVLSPGHRARMAEAQRLLDPFGVRLWGSHMTGVGVHSCCAPLP